MDGSFALLVTKVFTAEIERTRSVHLGKIIETTLLTWTDYERWSSEAWHKMSGVILHSPPDQFGYREDPSVSGCDGKWQLTLASLTLKAPVVVRYFGKRGDRR